MLFSLYRMGYKSRMTGHGFRGLAATVLREFGYSRDAVDRQLAHAHAHVEYIQERRRMMQHWADHLEAVREAAE